MDEFAKNEHSKSDEFTLLVGDLVYYTLYPYHVVFFRAVVILG